MNTVTTLNRPENVATMLLHVPEAQIKYTFLGNWPKLGSKRDEKVSIEIRRRGRSRTSVPTPTATFASLGLDKKGYQQDLLLAGQALAHAGFRVTSVQPAGDGPVLPRVIILESATLVAELRYQEPSFRLHV